ncbi:hypothetical protein KPL71_004990 [Citrus sinensis]|uniref:Uncharacterized protein n=1 Tax=Citrus sinensis TaxID=2711 RepID=A0ACB8N9P8_CITSI|nr:hypothetical protein KPL71_004990 [Citrus sinensis]
MSVTRDNQLNNIPADHNSSSGTLTRPLIQNPNAAFSPKNTNISEVPSYYDFTSQNTNLLPLNHHLADIAPDHAKSRVSEFNEQPLGSSRWNPTPEQLLALEEMYRRGTRTPSAEQIQHIASQLRRFGKIEGKNVFYWFQNHKARERQKRRRWESETNNSHQQKPHNTNHNIPGDKKDSGLRRTGYDLGQTKNWASSSYSEEFVSMYRAENTSCGPQYGWTQFDGRELQQGKSSTNITEAAEVMNATWHKMEYKKLLKTDHQNLSGFSLLDMKPYQQESEETKTLELFPLHRDDDDDGNSVNATKKDNNKVPITAINDTNNFTPSTSQYIEFLPLKN